MTRTTSLELRKRRGALGALVVTLGALASLGACDDAKVGEDDCRAETHCHYEGGNPTCDEGYEPSGGSCVSLVSVDGGCAPETTGDFCARQGYSCGTHTEADLCGVVRTFNCGTCPGPDAGPSIDATPSPDAGPQLPDIAAFVTSNPSYFDRLGSFDFVRIVSSDFSPTQTKAWIMTLTSPVGTGSMVQIEVNNADLASRIGNQSYDDNWLDGFGWEIIVPIDPLATCPAGVLPPNDVAFGRARVFYMEWASSDYTNVTCANAGSITFRGPTDANDSSITLDITLNAQFNNGSFVQDVWYESDSATW